MINKKIIIGILISSICSFFSCKTDLSTKIAYGQYFIEGNIKIIGQDTILNGHITFYDSTGNLVFITNYKDGIMNGLSKEFYKNKKIKQEVNYFYGIQHGITKDYDSTGEIIYQTNYFHGLKSGSQLSYRNDSCKLYAFSNFEDYILYSCNYINDSTIIETGGLLNYITYPIRVDSSNKIELFLYLIDPPHKKITYKLYDKNLQNQDSILVKQLSAQDGFFSDLQVDRPTEGHKYYFTIEAFYPKQNKLFKNILREEKREVYIPPL